MQTEIEKTVPSLAHLFNQSCGERLFLETIKFKVADVWELWELQDDLLNSHLFQQVKHPGATLAQPHICVKQAQVVVFVHACNLELAMLLLMLCLQRFTARDVLVT